MLMASQGAGEEPRMFSLKEEERAGWKLCSQTGCGGVFVARQTSLWREIFIAGCLVTVAFAELWARERVGSLILGLQKKTENLERLRFFIYLVLSWCLSSSVYDKTSEYLAFFFQQHNRLISHSERAAA